VRPGGRNPRRMPRARFKDAQACGERRRLRAKRNSSNLRFNRVVGRLLGLNNARLELGRIRTPGVDSPAGHPRQPRCMSQIVVSREVLEERGPRIVAPTTGSPFPRTNLILSARCHHSQSSAHQPRAVNSHCLVPFSSAVDSASRRGHSAPPAPPNKACRADAARSRLRSASAGNYASRHSPSSPFTGP